MEHGEVQRVCVQEVHAVLIASARSRKAQYIFALHGLDAPKVVAEVPLVMPWLYSQATEGAAVSLTSVKGMEISPAS